MIRLKMAGLLTGGFAALLILGPARAMAAQDAATPGQVASILPALPGGILRNDIAQVDEGRERRSNHLWIASILAMAAASGMDAGTSWGKLEGNSLLASHDGRFGAKGVSIKVGIAAGVIIPQILLRKHKNARMAFSLGNFAQAALFTGVAVHNLGIAAPK